MTVVEVRQLGADEVELLEQGFRQGTPGKHRGRLAAQQRGEAAYLVAWQGGVPLGHALLWWHGIADPVASRLRDCPHVEDVFVQPDRRSQGVGSLLLDRAESLAAGRGCRRIGLAVGIDNSRARALYERRGYADAGFGSYRIGGCYIGLDGGKRAWQEDCVYLIKALPAPAVDR